MPEKVTTTVESLTLWPEALRQKGIERRYPSLWVIGAVSIFDRPLLGLVCSIRCPGDAILQTYELAKALRDASIPVAGGFHSPMEKECLDLLLRGSQPVVICPPRSLTGMRVPRAWRPEIDAGRLLLVSPFGERHCRATSMLAEQRNHFVGAIAAEVVVPYAAPEGRTEALCREFADRGTPVWMLHDGPLTSELQPAVRSITPLALVEHWRAKAASA